MRSCRNCFWISINIPFSLKTFSVPLRTFTGCLVFLVKINGQTVCVCVCVCARVRVCRATAGLPAQTEPFKRPIDVSVHLSFSFSLFLSLISPSLLHLPELFFNVIIQSKHLLSLFLPHLPSHSPQAYLT